MSLFYLLDIYDTTVSESSSQTEILLFGINDTKRVCIRVIETPFCLFVQVPDDFEDLEGLKNEINTKVKPNKKYCMRTNCCPSTTINENNILDEK
jgi:hypothetical protein